MQSLTLVPDLQNIALALFCCGLILDAVKSSCWVVSDVAVHAGVALLAAECAITDGCVFSRAYPLLTIAAQFTILQLVNMSVPMRLSDSAITLLKAVEVTLALTGVSRGGVVGNEMAFIAMLLSTLLVTSACVASLADRWLYYFLTRDKSLPMVVLSLTLTISIMLRSPHFVALMPVAFGVYVSQTNVAWLALFFALSSSQSLYDKDAHGGGRGSALIVLSLPAVVACCLTYLGDLAAGVSLGLAACCVMVRRGRTLREVSLATWSCVVFPLLLSTLVPNMAGCWWAWFDVGNGLFSDGVSKRGWMGNVLSCFGVPGAVCLIVLTVCTIYAGKKSIFNDVVTGVMTPFLCVSWGVELAIGLLGTVWAIPPFFSCLTPLSGVTNSQTIPLVSGAAVGIAMACDLRVAEMVADDSGMAYCFAAVGSGARQDVPLLPPGSPGGEL